MSWTVIVLAILSILIAWQIIGGLSDGRWGARFAVIAGMGIVAVIMTDPLTHFSAIWEWGGRMLANDPTLFGGTG